MSPATRFDAPDQKATNRPSALSAGSNDQRSASVPSDATDTREVPPVARSWTNTSSVWLASPTTTSDAWDANATTVPSALIAGSWASPSEISAPPTPSDTRVVVPSTGGDTWGSPVEMSMVPTATVPADTAKSVAVVPPTKTDGQVSDGSASSTR